MQLVFNAPLRAAEHGRATIHLVDLPDELADYLNDLPLARHGFGSIKVEAGIGATTWKTSLFPSGQTFILLIARKLIARENLTLGRPIEITLEI